jgi:hypothetical protein
MRDSHHINIKPAARGKNAWPRQVADNKTGLKGTTITCKRTRLDLRPDAYSLYINSSTFLRPKQIQADPIAGFVVLTWAHDQQRQCCGGVDDIVKHPVNQVVWKVHVHHFPARVRHHALLGGGRPSLCKTEAPILVTLSLVLLQHQC